MAKKNVSRKAKPRSAKKAASKTAKARYELQIDLSVLDHLGINLYSNVPAVMTEMVANSWDADSTRVNIKVDIGEDYIEVADNGIGMNSSDINNKFLTVGYRRRADSPDGDRTPGGRPVMGRKGVGKLAPFSIADTVEIYSTKDGEKCGLSLSVNGIRKAKIKREPYRPEVLDHSAQIPDRGTKIVLRNLKRDRVKRANLRERLARRFSVIGRPEFSVAIDGIEVTTEDRGDLNVLQYIWTIGDWQVPSWCEPDRTSSLRDNLEGWPDDWRIRGWLGTSRKPKDLSRASGNLNGIVIIARGRLFQENILGEINDGRHYTKYITGQIEADFLDEGDLDIATSDRQRVIEDDPRYIQLISYLKSVLNNLESEWSKFRSTDDPEVVQNNYPQIREWIDGMQDSSHRKHAQKVIGVVERMQLEDSEKDEILKNTIFGFERLKLKGMTEELANALERGDSEVLKLFSDQDSLEASIYRDIVKGRLGAIQMLRDAVDKNAKEKVIQRILFGRLWLLDPSWERVTGTEEIEKRFSSLFPRPDSEDDESSKGRFDIAYRTVPGKHVVIELKRASRKVDILDLAAQGKMYVRELKRLLVAHGEVKPGINPDIEVIFVVGDPLQEQLEEPDSYKHQMNAISPGSRVCTYEELVSKALSAYKDYLLQTEHLGRLAQLIESIGRPQ